jgi:myo-inositol 2-dehydrogenase / D-chiro-inositol 1-dehydrogenase
MATYSGQVVKWDEAVAGGPDEMPRRFAFDADPPALPDKDGYYAIAMPGVYKPY